MALLKIKEINKKDKFKYKIDFLIYYFKNYQPATYYVSNGKLHCKNNKKRSFTDLLNLIKYYYPATSKKGLIRNLEKAALKIPIRGFYCDTTEDIVFFRDNNKLNKNLFSSIKYNSDKEHRSKLNIKGINMNILEKWMLNKK